jgi:Cdc6-like AAA superfamily ATPase
MSQSTKGMSEILGADTPTTNDLLGYKRLTEPIVRRISNATGKNTPLTIGVYGEWGSGKTSFLKMIDEGLQKQDIHPIWFNAWKYDQEDNLWSALIQTILDQARIRGKWHRRILVKFSIWLNNLDLRSGSWEIAKRFVPLGMRIIFITLILLVVFGWASSDIEAFLKQVSSQWFSSSPLLLFFFQVPVVRALLGVIAFLALKPDELWKLVFSTKLGIDFSKFKRSASYRAHIAFLDEFSDEFKRIIKLVGNGKPLVVVIDDLDRCLPEKAIQVLEAIKLFLDVEGCVFLLAVDRDVVEKAIAVKYKELLAMAKDTDSSPRQLFTSLGENYFEKIVQLPFSLPPISDEQFEAFVTKVHPDNDVQLCARIFTEGFPRNPRKVKRLLQTFLFLRDLDLVNDNDGIPNKKPSLIAKMVIIQSQFRRVYEEIISSPALLQELEKHYRRQASPLDSDNRPETTIDPVLQEKVKAFSTQYPNLRKLLLQKVNDNDTFIDVDLAPYISLAEPILEAKTISEFIQREDITPTFGQYLRQVVSLTQSLNIRGLASSVVSANSFEIEKMFVATSFVTANEGEKHLTLEEILQKSVRLAILGGPGTGKTTLLSYLANIFAKNTLLQNPTHPQNILGISENLLPILLPLREYGRYVEQNINKSASPAGFIEFIDDYFSQWNIELSSGFFVQFLERGNCIVLLDGLDEVNPSVREFVTQSILSLTKRYPISRIIVTSRPAAYFPYGLGEDFTHYEIASFDESSIAQFIRYWLASVFEDQTRARQQAESLLQVIAKNSQLSIFAKNPLLLTILIILYSGKGSLPLNRIDLYEDAIDVLLTRWDIAKGLQSSKINLAEVKNLLTILAFETQEANIDKMDESFITSIFSKELMKKELLSQPASLAQATSLLTTLKERAGILIETNPHIYSFVHLIFREYLAAIALTQSENFVDLVLQKQSDNLWQESVVLAIGLTSRTSPRTADKVIRKLIETQNSESILVAGHSFLETVEFKPELREKVVSALTKLSSDMLIADFIREQARTILEKLGDSN